MHVRSLEDVQAAHLRRMLSVERQAAAALPTLAQRAPQPMLGPCLRHWGEQGRDRLSRLADCFHLMDRSAEAVFCPVAAVLLDRAQGVLDASMAEPLRPVVLTAALRSFAAYQVTLSTEACDWAERLGRAESVLLLQQGLCEQKQTQQQLSDIAHQLGESAPRAA
jgi:Mn-containing catalase